MKTEKLFIQGLNRGITFYIGQNKAENFDVIDAGSPNDLWFHANDISSCHIVAVMPSEVSKKDKNYIVKAGALLCKRYTNKLKSLHDVEIIYTEIKNVVKTNVQGCVKITNDKKIVV